jgi:hypothetical protein
MFGMGEGGSRRNKEFNALGKVEIGREKQRKIEACGEGEKWRTIERRGEGE